MKKIFLLTVLISVLILAGCGAAEAGNTVQVSGVISSVYTHNTTMAVDGVTETWQYGTVIVMEDSTSYRILGAHEFEAGQEVELILTPFQDNWYLLD